MTASVPPWRLGALEAARVLARREISAARMAEACLERIAERETGLRAFAAIDPGLVRREAARLDDGPLRGPLHGVPLAVKDLIDTCDLPTGYGSPVYAGHRPACDAAVVASTRAAGAVVMGKTVTTEFAYFTPGPTRNPHDPTRSPGGSSSGSAAAVADFLVPLALGTQTAGSIIRPAAYCGVVGYKPSLGRVSRAGVKSLSETLDVVGGFGRTVDDVGLLGAVLTGDLRLSEPTRHDRPRIGLCRTPDWHAADADVQALFVQAVAGLGAGAAALVDVALPAAMPDLVALQLSVMTFEMSRALRAERLAAPALLSPRLIALLDAGMDMSGADHVDRLTAVEAARRQVPSLFAHCDVLLAPSTTGEAPRLDDGTGDPLFCRGWTLLGLPCLHLPLARGRHGLPIGLQLVGRWGDDHRLLACGRWIHERLSC
jgi:Asp-tRNA(Asn)/Glu-tRNA(Gln) amidotransferase A subunit family amidase